jgi:endo-1,4-beta-xylanase
LALGACMQREAVVKEPDAPASTTTPEANAQASTGKYGKVAGVDLLAGAGIDAFSVHGAADRVVKTVVAVANQPFEKAIRTEIKQRSQNLWDVQLSADAKGDVHKGDVLLVSFWFRTEYVPVESGEGDTEVNFELNHQPFDKLVAFSVRAGAQWKQVFVPFVAKRDFKQGEGQITFRLGYPPQTIDIADVKVENFENRLALTDLPRTKIFYAGMEANAPWRAQAEERIDRLRKADLTVRVVGSDGKPVANAEVSAQLTKHTFNFGTAVPGEVVLASDKPKLNQLLLENFNMATLENDLKWEALEDWG